MLVQGPKSFAERSGDDYDSVSIAPFHTRRARLSNTILTLASQTHDGYFVVSSLDMPQAWEIAMRWSLLPLALAVAFVPAVVGQGPAEERDYAKVPLDALGIKMVLPTKDAKTGFVVAGKNATKLIRGLTAINGQPIAKLEAMMRPKKLSFSGFLDEDEKLLDVLAADNEFVVGTLGRTHQELARPLLVAGAVGLKSGKINEWVPFRYHGGRYRVKVICFRGYQESPFRDGTKTNCNATVENLSTRKTLEYSLLVPLMIERYGFYEGPNVPYRVEPRRIAEVFDFLKKKSTSGDANPK